MRRGFLEQIVTIENKGFQAFLDGVPITECPYQGGYHNQNGPGGSFQRQRRQAWQRGWALAEKEAKDDR